MRLKNGLEMTGRVPDSWGEGGFAFWIEDMWSPRVYFVRGDSFSDAYEWFTEYLVEKGMLEDVTDEVKADASPEELELWEKEGQVPAGCEYVDGHNGVYYTENIGGRWVMGEDRG